MELSAQVVFECIFFLILFYDSQGRRFFRHQLTALNTTWKTFNSSQYPDPYPSNTTTIWLIRTTGDNSISLRYLSMDIEYSPNCAKDYLEIYNGHEDKNHLVTRQCGTEIFHIRKLGRYVNVYFYTDEDTSGKGFSIQYKAFPGGHMLFSGTFTLTSEEPEPKVMESPYYPDAYLNNLHTRWVITADNYLDNVQLILEELETECPNDVLAIYDGISEADTEVGHFCGKQSMEIVESTARKMLVSFSTDSTRVYKGFRAVYVSYRTGYFCNGTVNLMASTNKRQYFTSPNYPQKYPHNMVCTWVVRAPPMSWLTIHLLDVDITESDGCRYDSIQVFHGSTIVKGPLKTSCGSASSKITTLGTMTVVFTSSRFFSGRGFLITYYVGSAGVIGCPDEKALFATRFWRTLTSPSYPSIYEPNLNCSWTIRTEGSAVQLVEVEVQDGVLEDYTSCIYDSLTISEGSGQVLEKLCGERTARVLSSGPTLHLNFLTDETYDYRGFKLRYRMTSKEISCPDGSPLRADPRYKFFYSADNQKANRLVMSGTCTWRVVPRTPTGSVMVIISSNLDISTSCQKSSHLEVYEGPVRHGQRLDRFCSKGMRTYTGRSLTIVYWRIADSTSGGFSAAYKETDNPLKPSSTTAAGTTPEAAVQSQTRSVTRTIHSGLGYGSVAAIAITTLVSGFFIGAGLVWLIKRNKGRPSLLPGVIYSSSSQPSFIPASANTATVRNVASDDDGAVGGIVNTGYGCSTKESLPGPIDDPWSHA